MAIQVFSDRGSAGCCPRTPEKQEPTVTLTLTTGREAMTCELHPVSAKLLGEALIADAEAIMRLPIPGVVKLRTSDEY